MGQERPSPLLLLLSQTWPFCTVGGGRCMADWQLTCTKVSFNSCCYIIITSLIASVQGLGALTFSSNVTCSVALNVKTRMSFWIVRWEHGSAHVVSHRRSVLLQWYLRRMSFGTFEMGRKLPNVTSGQIILCAFVSFHSVSPPSTFAIQQLVCCLWSNGHGWAQQIGNVRPWSIKIPNDQTKKMHVLLVGDLLRLHCWIDDMSLPFLFLAGQISSADPLSSPSVIAPMPLSRHNDRSHLCVMLCQFAPAYQIR